MSNFANLKKQSSLGSLTDKLVKQVEKMNTTSGGADERLWKPEMDKTGVGSAVLRFLPARNTSSSVSRISIATPSEESTSTFRHSDCISLTRTLNDSGVPGSGMFSPLTIAS